MKNFKIGSLNIGLDSPPLFVAELGICHGGSIQRALKTAELAIKAGAHIIKTETFRVDELVFDSSIEMVSNVKNPDGSITGLKEKMVDHMKKYGLSLEEHAKINDLCKSKKVPFLSTVHDFEAIDFLKKIKADALKIASPDIIHRPLIEYAAKSNLPLVFDTGGAFQWEIERAILWAKKAGASHVMVNHHPNGHPAPAEAYNLNIISHLKNVLKIPVGTADHFDGIEMLYAAAALGANLIEKPVSLDPSIPEPEQIYALDVHKLEKVIDSISIIHKAKGLSEKTDIKISNNRVSLVAKTDLNIGDKLSLKNVKFGRPSMGILADDWNKVENHKVKQSIKKNQFIYYKHID